MIKRLKWNVLHADDDDGAGLSSSSEESEQNLSHDAALQLLLQNDPQLNASSTTPHDVQSETLRLFAQPHSRQKTSSCEHDSDDGNEQADATAPNRQSAQHMEYGFAEWNECLLCPGKKFFNKGDLKSHLESKKHLKALRKHSTSEHKLNVSMAQNEPQTGTVSEHKLNVSMAQNEPQTGTVSDAQREEPNERDPSRSPSKTTAPGLLTSSKSTGRCDGNSYRDEKHSHKVQNKDKIINEEQTQETPDVDARRRAKRKKEAMKRKLKSLKRRKWEKRNKHQAVHEAEASCK